MMVSLYKNGGFYIGRYELGTQVVNSVDEANNASRNENTIEKPTPIIKQNAMPYNFITQSEAQGLIKSLNHENTEDSLPFGLQWSIACVFIEHFGTRVNNQNQIEPFNSNYLLSNDYSRRWGNYSNSTFKINQGFYTTNYTTWNEVNDNTTKESNVALLCTTGASEKNKVLNIYDFAGNTAEWTLEYHGNSSKPCEARGGHFLSSSHYANQATMYTTTTRVANYSARATLFLE